MPERSFYTLPIVFCPTNKNCTFGNSHLILLSIGQLSGCEQTDNGKNIVIVDGNGYHIFFKFSVIVLFSKNVLEKMNSSLDNAA